MLVDKECSPKCTTLSIYIHAVDLLVNDLRFGRVQCMCAAVDKWLINKLSGADPVFLWGGGAGLFCLKNGI